MRSWLRVTTLSVALLASPSRCALAEWAVDVYGGAGFTRRHDATVDVPAAQLTAIHKSLEFDTAALIGGRFAYWPSRTALFGLAFDVSHFFGPDQRQQLAETELFVNGVPYSDSPELLKRFDISVTSLAFDVLYFRLPIAVSDTFPGGRVQPYVTAGPAIFMISMTDTGNFKPADQTSTGSSLGAQLGGGVNWLLTPAKGFFVEYRYSTFRGVDSFYNDTVVDGTTLGQTNGSATFNIDSVVAGMTFRF